MRFISTSIIPLKDIIGRNLDNDEIILVNRNAFIL